VDRIEYRVREEETGKEEQWTESERSRSGKYCKEQEKGIEDRKIDKRRGQEIGVKRTG
jgi:hypothetical protein